MFTKLFLCPALQVCLSSNSELCFFEYDCINLYFIYCFFSSYLCWYETSHKLTLHVFPQNIQVLRCIIIIKSTTRSFFVTYKRAFLIINPRHNVTHCSCQNNPGNTQNRRFCAERVFYPVLAIIDKQRKHHSNQTNAAISDWKPGSDESVIQCRTSRCLPQGGATILGA